MIFHRHIVLFGYLFAITIGKDLWYITDRDGYRNYTPLAVGITRSVCGRFYAVRFIFLHLAVSFGTEKFWQ